MNKHTPGPWESMDVGRVRSADKLVAMTYPCAPDGGETDEGQANARLIAAAPDMLAALKAIAEGCSFPEDEVQRAVCTRARAAIAKAEGRQ